MEKYQEYKYVTAEGLDSLIEGLMKEFRVYGTIRKDGFPAWGEIEKTEDLVLAQPPTHLSAKQFLFPPKETLLRFNIRENTHQPMIETEDQVLIGLHPCDIKAISLMDAVFSYGPKDANYLARREKTVIIGADCYPDRFCFCKSLGNMEAKEGFDIFLHKLSEGCLVRTGTERGKDLFARHTASREATSAQVEEFFRLQRERAEAFTAKLEAPPEMLPSVYKESDDSPVWEKIGSICYGCGSCNNVCPTCYCFDIKDEVKADLNEGERVRTWDGCTLEDFAKVAGNHNFRKTRAERLRHRFNRKFRYLSDRFSSLFCVGCGRCSRTCLVNINIADVTNELIREHNSR